jgi:tetratricopeptide (TPR) repeat protein
MRRTCDRALRKTMYIVAGLALVLATTGCDALDGRSRNKKGNRLFRTTQFVDAVAEYEQALRQVDDPTIHYNLGLAYSKVFKPGAENRVLLDVVGSPACQVIPNVSPVTQQVCVKPGDKSFEECDEKNVCPSSFKCQKTEICTVDNRALADLAAQHFAKWLEANPTDNQTRGLMTQVWIDSEQFDLAITYWEGLLAQKPGDPDIMGSLAGINLKADNWRKSIEWYTKVADAVSDPAAKIAALQFIGNVAWSKLNSKTLSNEESVELADRGIGALQKAAALQPQNPKPFGLMASIYNFRAVAHGASWAAALDRAAAQDLQLVSRVLNEEAKKAQGLSTEPAPGTPAPGAATTPNPDPAKTGG